MLRLLQSKLLCWHWCLIKLQWQSREYKPLNVWVWQQSQCQREGFLFRCYHNKITTCFSVMHFSAFLVSVSSCDRACLSSLVREAFQEGPLPTANKSAGCCNSSMSTRVAFCQVSAVPTGSFSVCLWSAWQPELW